MPPNYFATNYGQDSMTQCPNTNLEIDSEELHANYRLLNNSKAQPIKPSLCFIALTRLAKNRRGNPMPLRKDIPFFFFFPFIFLG